LASSLAVAATCVVLPAAADDCRERFIGDWDVTLKTGQTYVGHHHADGTMTADCPGCSGRGTWTCQGNVIYKKLPWTSYSGTLSADGTTLTEPYGTATRRGPPPAATTPTVCPPETVRAAQDAMRRAQLAEAVMRSEPKYQNWSIVDTDLMEAIKLWQGCDPVSASTAQTERKRVADEYNRLVQRKPPPKQPDKPAGGCDKAKAHLDPYRQSMGDAWYNDQLKQMGCL